MESYIMVQVNESEADNQVLVFQPKKMVDRFTKVIPGSCSYLLHESPMGPVLEAELDSEVWMELESVMVSLPEFMEDHGLSLDWGRHSNPAKHDRKMVVAMIEDAAAKIEAAK